MAPQTEKSQLKRGRQSAGEENNETKKPRRSERISSQSQSQAHTANSGQGTTFKNSQLPSPLTRKDTSDYLPKELTATPPEGRPSQIRHHTPVSSPKQKGLSSPPSDTQPFSQFVYPPKGHSHEVENEEEEGVWGYLLPLDREHGEPLVLRRRTACPLPRSGELRANGKQKVDKKALERAEERFEETREDGYPSGGYLIGRHPECDRVLNVPTISNRHCLLFHESKGGDTIAIVEDLSGNGTFVNETIVGRNKRRELKDGDEIAILDEARFIFRYTRSRSSHGFRQQYSMLQQLGKGHFATVYLCVEKCSGMKYAVKKFEKREGPGERSRVEGLQQEVGVLMGVSHPNVLCLKDAFDEFDGFYLVLELAVEGELFNWIVMNSKLSESETRKVFTQLFLGLKYLHERNIVHRDIKPENILLVDKDLSVKLADFGLAKIIGEESFTTTLCGTPSYVAPEILESSSHRRYTRAVDVWSLGVVLYICLCGFPPFSDELYSPENPYNLSQQIKMGRFDYPSPYWDPVSDMALDLIDRMLTVDVEKRITVDECLEHPWTTQRELDANDSTDGLTTALGNLDFSKRKPQRERTLLSSINDIKVSQTVPVHNDDNNGPQLKVFEKNRTAKPRAEEKKTKSQKAKGKAGKGKTKQKEAAPGDKRAPGEFMQLGGGPDDPLFKNDGQSRYAPGE